jgi:hypothetical protein
MRRKNIFLKHRQFEESIPQFQDAKMTRITQDQPRERSKNDEKLAFEKLKKT